MARDRERLVQRLDGVDELARQVAIRLTGRPTRARSASVASFASTLALEKRSTIGSMIALARPWGVW